MNISFDFVKYYMIAGPQLIAVFFSSDGQMVHQCITNGSIDIIQHRICLANLKKCLVSPKQNFQMNITLLVNPYKFGLIVSVIVTLI